MELLPQQLPGIPGVYYSTQAITAINDVLLSGTAVLYASEQFLRDDDDIVDGELEHSEVWTLIITIPNPNNQGQRLGRFYTRTLVNDDVMNPNGPAYVFEEELEDFAHYQAGGGCRAGPAIKRKSCRHYDGPDTNSCVVGPKGRCRNGTRLAPKRKATPKQLAALEKARAVRKANLAKKQTGGGWFW